MIKVLLFAHLKEQLNRSEITIDRNEMTVGELRAKLGKDGFLPQASSVMIAVNEEFAQDEDIIRDGDVVALIPPVSGG
ncbi:molybdopterin synthase sulfur carrier subunit [Weizmannia acidilactici]|uniref:Molybdopterin synthase sulfur carrier subunit n=1 Tax=Weizmannia acidilactici TaxID=2607726 RepID=A0A5J4JG12_9BACI|nr:molybdopterin converting factor subunit 1 [Weizmannia acidilactici]GER66427.1 molybdopterin synthase sulfur carrier subunit [Weizmannia acidilactici]GER69427.1 molybdopterin synthase sulfur carrier subunit [Weizmannia acidilactici]GER72245.1 molybdopterin synthase sulfur carrier subunit [Weizmannia acidilactici]